MKVRQIEENLNTAICKLNNLITNKNNSVYQKPVDIDTENWNEETVQKIQKSVSIFLSSWVLDYLQQAQKLLIQDKN